jgi:hypothetical protein
MFDEVGGRAGLLESLRHWSASNSLIYQSDFQRLLDLMEEEIPLSEWREVVNFASDQCARWEAQWLLSPANSPNAQAAKEAEAWRQSYRVCADTLIRHVPDVRNHVDETHRLRGLGRIMERRLETAPGRIDRSLAAFLSKVAIKLGRVGLRRASGYLYAAALFPKGTVGRKQYSGKRRSERQNAMNDVRNPSPVDDEQAKPAKADEGWSTVNPAQIRQPAPMHPLEGKAWFRFAKVIYISLGIVGLGISAILASVNGLSFFVIGVIAVVAALFILRKGFYYVVLGRTTPTEKAGSVYIDLDELRQDFGGKTTNPQFKSVIEPYLNSLEAQYGRRVPVHTIKALQEKIHQDVDMLKQKRMAFLKEKAREGSSIPIAELRETIKGQSHDPNNEERNREIDRILSALEAEYGPAIPVDKLQEMVDEIEADLRRRGERL